MSEPDEKSALGANFFVGAAERDAISLVRDATKQVLPKRFYKEATVAVRDGGFDVLLDGRPVRTPRQRPLALPTLTAAELIAAEWRAQVETIDPATMPLTRLVNAALDGVADDIPATAAEIVKYAGSDLLCYRAIGTAVAPKRRRKMLRGIPFSNGRATRSAHTWRLRKASCSSRNRRPRSPPSAKRSTRSRQADMLRFASRRSTYSRL